MTIIKCKQCKKDKHEIDFSLFRGKRNKTCIDCRNKNNQWYAEDKDGRKSKAKSYYKRIKHKVAQYRSDLRLDRKYNLTREKWTELLKKQNGKCLICEEVMKQPCVDHNHKTGKVRGLLCRICNLKLQALEDEHFALQAQKYLNSMT